MAAGRRLEQWDHTSVMWERVTNIFAGEGEQVSPFDIHPIRTGENELDRIDLDTEVSEESETKSTAGGFWQRVNLIKGALPEESQSQAIQSLLRG